jgi:hypothetical protein
MYSSNYLLSQLGVPYDEPALDVDQRANDALTILAAATAGSYRTPGFVHQPISSASYDAANINAMSASAIACRAAIATGHLDTVHAAVDTLNNWRAKTGGGEYQPIPDLDILSNSHLSVGSLLRRLQNMEPLPLLLSDLAKANGIVQDSKAFMPHPPPPPVNLVIPAPAGFLLPSGTVIPAPDGSNWTFYSTPFGNIFVKSLLLVCVMAGLYCAKVGA